MRMWSCVFIAAFASLSGCHKQPSAAPSSLEIIAPSPDGVLFNAVRTSVAADGTEAWTATYAGEGQTARFSFFLGKTQPLGSDRSLGFGHGHFVAVANSQDAVLLRELRGVLQAKEMPLKVKRSSELPFTFADLGDGMSRLPDGGFSFKPPGHWHVLKLFLSGASDDEDEEVYFNLDADAHKGEFTIKDPDYGDGVLAQLAKIL